MVVNIGCVVTTTRAQGLFLLKLDRLSSPVGQTSSWPDVGIDK
uniref:Uncharacterized protein n=1 Tax=Anopheles dirus TaxID=7168 RepID=A0A182NYN4_9DIPT